MRPHDVFRNSPLRRLDLRRRLGAVRRPEYTGQNRCWPCTVLNVALVAGCGVLLSRFSLPLALLGVAFGIGLVILRGYVVPGTPWIAPWLVAPLPFDVGHDRHPSGSLADEDGAKDPDDVLATLVETSVLTPEGDQLFLDSTFRESWTGRMAALRDSDDETLLARVTAASPGAVDGQLHGDRLLLAGTQDVWLSRPVAIAETAAVETLAEWGVPGKLRPTAARPLRTFLNTCPECGGDVRETTVQNCCGGSGSVYRNPERPVLACTDCDALVFAFDRKETSGHR